MNTYITLACLLAVLGVSQGNPVGIGAPWLGPAISTANLVKAAPIPIIRTHISPIISAPVVRTVPIVNTVPIGGLGLSGLGWGGLGWGGLGWGGLGWGGHGGLGWGGHGGLGWGKGVGKIYG